MRDLSALLQARVVAPLNELGIPIDLRGVQALLLLLPVALLALGFVHAWWKKKERMKDAGM